MDINLNVTLFQESVGDVTMWVAACVDPCVVAQGDTIEEVKEAFEKTFIAQIWSDKGKGQIMESLEKQNIKIYIINNII